MQVDINHFLKYSLKKYNPNDYEFKEDVLTAKKDIDKDFYNFFEYIVKKDLFYFHFMKIIFSQKGDKIQVCVDNQFNSNIECLGNIDENRNFVTEDIHLNVDEMIDYIQKVKKATFVMNIKEHGFFKIDFNSYCELDSYDIYQRVDDIYISIEISKTKWTLNSLPQNKQVALLSNKKEILVYSAKNRILLPLKKINSFNFEIENIEYSDFKDAILFKSKSLTNREISKVNYVMARLWDISSILSGRLEFKYYLGFKIKEDGKYDSNIVVDIDYERFDLSDFVSVIKENKDLFTSPVFDFLFENIEELLFNSYGITEFNIESDFSEILEVINCSSY